MNKFWNIKNEVNNNELFLRGVIAEESWFGDEVTPKMFRDELNKCHGKITVWINSPGGDVFAASEIYTALLNYAGPVVVKIEGMAASAASVIAMAATKVQISPTAQMMIHNPSTIAVGDKNAMKQAMAVLDSIKESIINAYEKKTCLDRDFISDMMNKETWMDANRAIELNFADEMIEKTEEKSEKKDLFNKEDFRKIFNSVNENMMKKIVAKYKPGLRQEIPVENKKTSGDPGEGGQKMFKNAEDLRQAAPEIFDAAIKEATDKAVKEITETTDKAVKDAVEAERKRLQDIEEIAGTIDAEMVKDAKYVNPITAADLALKAKKAEAKLGATILNQLKVDGKTSGADGIDPGHVPSADDELHTITAEEKMAAGREAGKKVNGGK